MLDKSIYNLKAIAAEKKRAIRRELRKIGKAAAKACRKPSMQEAIDARVNVLAARVVQRAPAVQAFKEPPTYRPGMGKEFYQTRAWRELRYQVLTKHGAKCQCCGEVHGYMHVDHIRPRSKHPGLEMDAQNLQILCAACNIGKSNKDATDWRNTRSVGVALAPSTA